MKKIIAVSILVFLISAGAFANHPSGWGMGIVGQYDVAWDVNVRAPGAAFSLKTPQSPIYWGLSVALRDNGFGVSMTGDRYLVDATLIRGINFGWYLGLGAYAGVFGYTGDEKGFSARAGARVPIGVYVFPVNFFEVFFDIAPSLGMALYLGDRGGKTFPIDFPDGGIGADIGIRFWF